jgi:hypothetical protein
MSWFFSVIAGMVLQNRQIIFSDDHSDTQFIITLFTALKVLVRWEQSEFVSLSNWSLVLQ